MPSGVSYDFLTLLEDGKRRGILALGPLLVAGLAGGFVAEMLDPGRAGPFVWLYASAIVVGVGAGAFLGWREIRSWGESLRDGWTDWMHSAQGAGSVAEVAERAGAPRLHLNKIVGGLLAVANGAVLVAAWFQLPPWSLQSPYGVFAIATVACTGLGLGGQAALRIAEAWWCRQIEDQTLSLVEKGRVGVWGVR